jgi:hypothetical protein
MSSSHPSVYKNNRKIWPEMVYRAKLTLKKVWKIVPDFFGGLKRHEGGERKFLTQVVLDKLSEV